MKNKFKKIRGEGEVHVIHDPWTFNETPVGWDETSHVINGDSLDSCVVKREVSFDCGCLNTLPGGFCAVCVSKGRRGLTCKDCFGHCRCGKPICNGHAVLICFDDGRQFRLCRQCDSSGNIKQLIDDFVRIFLPFS